MLTPNGVGFCLIFFVGLLRASDAGKVGSTLFLWLLFTGMVANAQTKLAQ
jgi:hypothetical protein